MKLDNASDTRATVELHNKRWAQGDVAGLFALYHRDMLFTDHYSGKTYQGEALREHVSEVIRRSALDSLVYSDSVRVDGDTAFLQYTETIRSADGSALLTIRACDAVRVQRRLIVDIQEYAIPVQVEAIKGDPLRGAGKIGLTARDIGYLLNDLSTYMERDKPYLKPALSLHDVAKATGYSRNQISFALNHASGTTFYAFINRARIEYILRINADLKAQGVQHLAESAGFRSISTFYAAFKAVTGKRPREHFILSED